MDAKDLIIRRMTKDELVLALDWAACRVAPMPRLFERCSRSQASRSKSIALPSQRIVPESRGPADSMATAAIIASTPRMLRARRKLWRARSG